MVSLTHFITFLNKYVKKYNFLRNRSLETKRITDVPPFMTSEQLSHYLHDTVCSHFNPDETVITFYV